MRKFDKILVSISISSFSVIIFILFAKSINSYTNEDKIFFKNNSQKLIEMQKEIPETFKNYYSKSKGTFMEEEIIRIIDIEELTEKTKEKNNRTKQKKLHSNKSTINQNSHKIKNKKSIIQFQKEKLIFTHKVQSGESIWSIAKQYEVPIYTIISLNEKISNKIIYPGYTIRVSRQKGIFYKIKKGDNLTSIAQKYKISLNAISKSNNINSVQASQIHVGKEIFLPNAKPTKIISKGNYKNIIFSLPIKGRISSSFGNRVHPIFQKNHLHRGIDIAAPNGKSIYSPLSGIVIFAGNKKGYGKTIIICNTKRYHTIFAHCSKIYIKKSQYVKKGTKIGAVGSTGYSTGPHLHFELWKDNKPVDPIPLIGKSLYSSKLQ